MKPWQALVVFFQVFRSVRCADPPNGNAGLRKCPGSTLRSIPGHARHPRRTTSVTSCNPPTYALGGLHQTQQQTAHLRSERNSRPPAHALSESQPTATHTPTLWVSPNKQQPAHLCSERVAKQQQNTSKTPISPPIPRTPNPNLQLPPQKQPTHSTFMPRSSKTELSPFFFMDT